jgi:hypothetical protein
MNGDCPITIRTRTQDLVNSNNPIYDVPSRISINPSRLSMLGDKHTPITLTCHNITYIVKSQNKQILFDVSGIFSSGMNAILGKIEVFSHRRIVIKYGTMDLFI